MRSLSYVELVGWVLCLFYLEGSREDINKSCVFVGSFEGLVFVFFNFKILSMLFTAYHTNTDKLCYLAYS